MEQIKKFDVKYNTATDMFVFTDEQKETYIINWDMISNDWHLFFLMAGSKVEQTNQTFGNSAFLINVLQKEKNAKLEFSVVKGNDDDVVYSSKITWDKQKSKEDVLVVEFPEFQPKSFGVATKKISHTKAIEVMLEDLKIQTLNGLKSQEKSPKLLKEKNNTNQSFDR